MRQGCRKSEYELPEGVHYLNCAYMAPFSKAVAAAGHEGIGRRRWPAELGPKTFFEDAERARRLFGELVGGEGERVAIIPAASYGLATVARNLKLEAGQRIVLPAAQFPSNVYIWRRFREMGVELVTVPAPSLGGKAWSEAILEAMTPETGLVAMSHVHWADGSLFDLAAIGARARELGAAMVIDGTQSIGALPFDVRELQPDAVIAAGYKWLMGPYGMGYAWYGPRFDDGEPLEDNWISRLGSENFRQLVNYQDAYAPGARRYDVGERGNFIQLPMSIKAMEELTGYGIGAIQAYCEALIEPFLPRFEELGIRVAAAGERSSHLFGLRLPGETDLDALQGALEERAVYVSMRGQAIRVSPHTYNTEADLEALLGALRSTLG